MKRNKFYWPLVAALTAIFTLAMGAVAIADQVSNNLDTSIDSTLETMNLTVGNTGSVQFYMNSTNDDAKNGCNLTGSGSQLVLGISSSNIAVASLSGSSVTITACGDPTTALSNAITVTGNAVGSAIVTVTFTSVTTSSAATAASNYTLDTAAFTVNVVASGPTCTNPSVTTNPSNSTITYGQDATFSAAASGSPTPSIQWQVSTDSGSTYSDLSGETGSSLIVSAPTVAMSGNKYHAVFTNTCGSTASGGATLTVDLATVNVMASGSGVTYGDPVPTITPSYSGFVLGQTESVLTTAPTCSTTYSQGSDVSGSPYLTSCMSAAADNYTFTYTPGSVTVAKAPLTVTADSQSIYFSNPDPTFTFQYSGFALSETAAVIDTPPTCGVSGSHTAVGTYTITCSGGLDNNYSFTYVNGTLDVQPWRLTGFYAPLDPNPSVWNTVKGGSTVPLKFNIYAGTTQLSDTADVQGFAVTPKACPTTGYTADTVDFTLTGGTILRWDSTAQQFVQNWATPKKPGSCYKVTMMTKDGSSLSALFMLK